MLLAQAAPRDVVLLVTQAADHVTGLTGATLALTLSKDGGAFAAIAPTVAERGAGLYELALDGSMTDTPGDLVLVATAPGGDPALWRGQVVPGLSFGGGAPAPSEWLQRARRRARRG